MEQTLSQPRANEFVIRFANVNGSGSASANGLVAKTIFRMGVPIGPKNMFPSNVQGLPTWFEIRVSERGYTARRGGVDIMVAMNRQTLEEDTRAVDKDGFLLYDSTAHLDPRLQRKDIRYLPLPLSAMASAEFSNPRQRILLQNLVYVGALVHLVRLDHGTALAILDEQYKAKPKLIEANHKALSLGMAYAQEHFPALPFFARKGEQAYHEDKILIEGNQAAALGCLYAGATVAGWYPITPSTSLVESFSRYCARTRIDKATGEKNYAIVQAEDEMSAIGIVMGAFWNGCRAFTATSGPGVSLMTEFLGYAYYAEVPAVLFNIQRCGPSTGLPTRTQQADLLLCAYASHGDTKHILLFPTNPEDCFHMAMSAFDLAERFQTPVIVMSDLEIGMNEFMTDPLRLPENFKHDRGKLLRSEELGQRKTPYFRYLDEDKDGVPYRTLPGDAKKGAYSTRGSGHDKYGRYTEDSDAYTENMERMVLKFEQAAKMLPPPFITRNTQPSHKILVVYYGSTQEALLEALDDLQENHNITLDHLCIKGFPFASELATHFSSYDALLIVEQNRDAQMRTLLMSEIRPFPSVLVKSVLSYDGMPLTSRALSQKIRDSLV